VHQVVYNKRLAEWAASNVTGPGRRSMGWPLSLGHCSYQCSDCWACLIVQGTVYLPRLRPIVGYLSGLQRVADRDLANSNAKVPLGKDVAPLRCLHVGFCGNSAVAHSMLTKSFLTAVVLDVYAGRTADIE